jgi:hypothetical protein
MKRGTASSARNTHETFWHLFPYLSAGEWRGERRTAMTIKLNESSIIENLGKYPADSVENLRQLLAKGAPAKPDSHRKDFYELQNGSRVYWIHISPVNGHVVLLAIWQKPIVTSTAALVSHAA